MTALLLTIALGALSFSGEPLDGISISPVNPYSGASQCAWLACDINQDGAQDWLTPDGVYLQHEGRYPRTHFLPFTDVSIAAKLDVWKGTLYAWDTQSLARMRIKNGKWENVAHEKLPHPAVGSWSPGQRSRQISRFLFDLDQNGTPELLLVTEKGAQLFRMKDNRHVPAGMLEVLPPMSLLPASHTELWPPESRHIQIPQRYRFARLWLDATTVNTLTWDSPEPKSWRFTLDSWPVVPDTNGTFALGKKTRIQTQLLPESAMPCRLNQDNVLDFAGIADESATGAALPQPILATWATLDLGQNIARRRSGATFRFRQHTHFVDFDGDGNLDWVVESPDLFQHGLRDTFTRFTTRRQVNHTIKVYLQKQKQFTETPAVSHTVTLQFSAPPIQAAPDYETWLAGRRVNITGDFNGDGYRDLVVRERVDRLTIYLAEGFQYPRKPSATISIDPAHDFAVFDVNGDGLSDILIYPPQHVEQTAPPIVHYSRGASR